MEVFFRSPDEGSLDRRCRAESGGRGRFSIGFQQRWRDYGWRGWSIGCYPPGSSCDRAGISLPILEYGRQFGQSVTGGYVYRGSNYPALRGFYMYGDFGSGILWAVQPQGSGWDNRLVMASQRQISTFGEDESGELYLADYRGEIYRITAGPPTASVNAVSAG